MLTKMFNRSSEQGRLLKDWKKATVAPLFKDNSKSQATMYRPMSLVCIAGKLMGRLIFIQLRGHLQNHQLLSPQQHSSEGDFPVCPMFSRFVWVGPKHRQEAVWRMSFSLTSVTFSTKFHTIDWCRKWNPSECQQDCAAGLRILSEKDGLLLGFLIRFLPGRHWCAARLCLRTTAVLDVRGSLPSKTDGECDQGLMVTPSLRTDALTGRICASSWDMLIVIRLSSNQFSYNTFKLPHTIHLV